MKKPGNFVREDKKTSRKGKPGGQEHLHRVSIRNLIPLFELIQNLGDEVLFFSLFNFIIDQPGIIYESSIIEVES